MPRRWRIPLVEDWTYAAMLPTMLLLGLAFRLSHRAGLVVPLAGALLAVAVTVLGVCWRRIADEVRRAA